MSKKDGEKKKKKPKIRSAVKAILIRDGKILLQHCQFTPGDICYLFPGGGQKFEETKVDALRREVLEEVGAEISVGRLVWIREYIQKNHEFKLEDGNCHQVEHYFLCELLTEPDPSRASKPDPVQIGIDWIPLTELASVRVYPKSICDRFDANGWIDGPYYGGDVN